MIVPDMEGPFLGVALECDREGTILSVIRDDLGCVTQNALGRTFLSIIADHSIRKALDFFLELKQKNAVFNCEMHLQEEELCPHPLHFVGGTLKDSLLIVGSNSRAAADTLYDELIKMNNEHINVLRSSISEIEVPEDVTSGERDIYSDLTRLNNELVTLQRDLFKKNKELERLNETKNQFIGMAAHDLRNPLSSFSQVTELLLTEDLGPLTEEQRDFLEILHKSSLSMLTLVNDLLDLSHIESGRLELNKRKTDVKEFLLENQKLHTVMAERKKITLEYEYPQNEVRLYMDPDRVSQVINNLIHNALKFSPPDTEVKLTVEPSNREYVFGVHDFGPGIPKEEQDKLFKPFAKLSVRGTGDEKSSGLGLAISRIMVEAHGGRIWAESEVGTGSSFYFSLPQN
jgi:two-component system, OmpR family, sensor kinase